MTSVYQEKIYPEVPSAPPEDDRLAAQQEQSQTYRLKKIEEVEAFLRSEVEQRGKLGKKFKRIAKGVTIGDFTALGLFSALEVLLFTTGVGIPFGIFIGVSVVGVVIGTKTQKFFGSKAKKHDKIKTLAESKLDSISDLVSKAIEDAHISHEEYQFILKEIEHYRTMKEQIRAKSKKVTDTITAEQREAILAQGREEGKQAFLRKIAASSDIQTANAM